jgi:hypothetical protein
MYADLVVFGGFLFRGFFLVAVKVAVMQVMSYAILRIWGFLLLLVGLVGFAMISPVHAGAILDYFPLQVGNSWVYTLVKGAGSDLPEKEATLRVSEEVTIHPDTAGWFATLEEITVPRGQRICVYRGVCSLTSSGIHRRSGMRCWCGMMGRAISGCGDFLMG